MTPPPIPQPLHSILLAIKTSSGPRLVLHYPPDPDAAVRSKLERHPRVDTDDAEYDYEESDDEDDGAWLSSHGRNLPNTPAFSSTLDSQIRNHEDDSGLEFGSSSADAMARLLTPAERGWNKRRFELTLEDRTYLACPIFSRSEDGGWAKTKKVKTEKRGDDKGRALPDGKREEDEPQDGGFLGDLDEADQRNDEDGHSKHKDGEVDAKVMPDLEEAESDNEADDTDTATTVTGVTAGIRIPERPKQEHDSLGASSSLVPGSFATTGSFQSQASSNEASRPQTLLMFSLVFVIEADGEPDFEERVKQIYSHVVRQLTRALKMTQKKSGWLFNQCRTIIDVREKGKDEGVSYKTIWPSIASRSSLARALATTFDKISKGDIAVVALGPSKSPMQVSLQIPQPFTTPLVPTPMNPDIRGLFTTTYDPYQIDETDAKTRSGPLSPHCAILLLVPAAELLKEVTTTTTPNPMTAPLIQLLKHYIPTKTLTKLARICRLSLPTVHGLSANLILWRRAIAIPPLHPGHTYVVNPNADFTKLEEASKVYANQFPLLPSLTNMLSKLSGTNASKTANSSNTKALDPQIYGAIIPSSDHKIPYMEVLEWLMRDGWLMQLRTFAWVRISPQIKAQVAREYRKEARKAELQAEAESDLDVSGTAAVTSDDEVGFAEGESIEKDRKRSSGGSVAVPAQSPRLRALLGPSKAASETGSSNSAQTTVRISNGLRIPSLAGRGRSSGSRSNRSTRLSDGSSQSKSQVLSSSGLLGSSNAGAAADAEDEGEELSPDQFEPSLVLSPHRADALESRWLKAVGDSLPTKEMRERWPKIMKYFDGQHALEEISLREGWKRKVISPMLAKWMDENDGGVLRVVQHW